LKGYEGTVQAESSYTAGDDLLGRLNSIKYSLPEDAYDKIDPTLVCVDCKCDRINTRKVLSEDEIQLIEKDFEDCSQKDY